mmetsp:Transcript_125413/g.366335  ORF Transcript_125413/g.366335 Transcript_125413/m.366335 type:complete len:232 (-) Transcript_125413:206-901(-)
MASVDDSRLKEGSSAVPETFGVHENVWTREEAADGRVYFFNRATGASQWHVPNELYGAASGAEGAVAMPGIAKAVLQVDCVTEFPPSRADPVESKAGSATGMHEGEVPTGQGTSGQPMLHVTFVSARGLRESSSSYCSCEILGKPDAKALTEVVSESLEPTFNQKILIPQYISGDIVILSVWSKDPGGAGDELLGRAMLADEDLAMDAPKELHLEEGADSSVYLTVHTKAA